MPIGEILHGLILFAEKTQRKDSISDSLPPQIRQLLQFILEGWFNGAMREAREATRQAKINNLTPEEQAEILARHEENEKKTQAAYEAVGLPWPPNPDEKIGEIVPPGMTMEEYLKRMVGDLSKKK
jgi:hypothetical protein